MAKEIERKFLVTDTQYFYSLNWKYGDVEQYYIVDSPTGELRVTHWSEKTNEGLHTRYKLCHKDNGLNSLVREENECFITKEIFDILVLSGIRRSQKKRYYGTYQNYYIEVDDFKHTSNPLLLAEVEFSSIEEANIFEPSLIPWFGEEVTENNNFRGKNIASEY